MKMSELTNTEKRIQRKAGRVPRIVRKQVVKLLTFLYKDKINNEKSDELKVPYAQSFSIGVEDSETNLVARAVVKDILYTKYNENDNKTLHDYFISNKANAIHKWFSYFDVYERHFSRFRGKDVNILEVGVQNGGSARMWKHYFTHNGVKVNIYGVDIDKRCKNFKDEGISIFIGSQEDREFWQKIKKTNSKS